MELFIIITLLIIVAGLVLYISQMSHSARELSAFLKEISLGNLNARLFSSRKGRLDSIARDITSIIEKTKSRLDFAEAERQRMEAILRGMSDGVLITDTRGMVILANRTFRKLLGVHENIEGKQIVEVLRNMQMVEIFRKAMDSWEIISEEIRVSRPDKDMHLIATAVPVYTKDSVSGTVLTLHDISRLRQLEEIRKDFVANVSHEIKT
ncbi:MAG: PAS domain-containing protein, partial [Nitrospirae bacterium]|nr:PAS domain-containing protein [Nitrospirota bacterium]